MRNLLLATVNQHRVASLELMLTGTHGDSTCGVFVVPSLAPMWRPLNVIACVAMGWDHVSVSTHPGELAPMWEEMDHVKRLFFNDDEIVVQFHVPPAQHINNHRNCLHLWRKHGAAYELPPREMV